MELTDYESIVTVAMCATIVLLIVGVIAVWAWNLIRAIVDHVREFRAMELRERKRYLKQQRNRDRGYLICDQSMALAKTIAGIVNVSPETHRAEFVSIFDACTQALERYEQKAERQHRHENPCSLFELPDPPE